MYQDINHWPPSTVYLESHIKFINHHHDDIGNGYYDNGGDNDDVVMGMMWLWWWRLGMMLQ